MSIPEMRDIKRKDIRHAIKLKIATRNRALKDAASKINSDTSVEAFNNLDYRREPDTVGITVYYPNKEAPTHFKTEFFPVGITDKEFERQVKRMEKELLAKVPNLRK